MVSLAEMLPGGFRIRTGRFLRWMSLLGGAIVLAILAAGGLVLHEARQDAWRRAEGAAANLAVALERDIARNVASYDLSLQGVVEALQLPALAAAPPALRRMALFDRAAGAEFLGSLVVFDREGRLVEASGSLLPPRISVADREHFAIHRDRPDAGLHIGRVTSSRLRDGEMVIPLSRRIDGPEGGFEGVVSGTLRLAYFQDLFGRLDLGSRGSVSLLRADGRLLARQPASPGDLDRDLSAADTFRRFVSAPSGQFTGQAAIDGVRRLYTFRRVGDLPLILSVAVAEADITAAWWPKARVTGAIILGLCAAIVALCALFRREMERRVSAEEKMAELARRLATMAATDGLTGLANRRRFDASLDVEWRRAARSGLPLSLLMLDADHFKAFNDLYGHPEGDEVLRRVAACIRASLNRPSDAGARYGGEEFAVLLPETEFDGAMALAERIRRAVAALALPHERGVGGRVTVSVGVASLYPQPGGQPSRLVREADLALYEAKRAGRDRVAAAGAAVAGLPDGLGWT